MSKNENADWIVKLLVIGDQGVGKTNLLYRICDNKFVTNHMPTIGIDFKFKTINVDGKTIKLQIWDTAGQERFRTITQTYYKGAMGIIMGYSIIERKSFDSIENWMKQIKANASEDVVLLLIGCKSDLEEEREITLDEGKALAKKYGIAFFETSAKTGFNIQESFEAIAKEIKDKILENQNQGQIGTGQPGMQLDKSKETKKKGGCC